MHNKIHRVVDSLCRKALQQAYLRASDFLGVENNVNVIQLFEFSGKSVKFQSVNNTKKKKLFEKRNGANLSKSNSNGLFFFIIFISLNMEQIIANLLVADNAVIQKVWHSQMKLLLFFKLRFALVSGFFPLWSVEVIAVFFFPKLHRLVMPSKRWQARGYQIEQRGQFYSNSFFCLYVCRWIRFYFICQNFFFLNRLYWFGILLEPSALMDEECAPHISQIPYLRKRFVWIHTFCRCNWNDTQWRNWACHKIVHFINIEKNINDLDLS